MSAAFVFTLEPARFFSSRGSSGAAVIHSDTLMAALRCASEESGAAGEILAREPPPFVVSSVFPEVSGVRLYPRPLGLPAPLRAETAAEAERTLDAWRRVEWVSEARLESIAEGRRIRFDADDVAEGRVWGMPSERGLEGLPRRVRRAGIAAGAGGSGPEGGVVRFEREEIALGPTTRLFFLARIEEPSALAPLRDLVERLGESGLGGGRSRGAGRFRLASAHAAPGFLGVERAAVERTGDAKSDGAALLLSLYLPSCEEVEAGVLEGAALDLVVRGGWIHSGGPTALRKRSVRMLQEGSVTAAAAPWPRGEVRDVRPADFDRHPVWRDGRAFAIRYRGES